MLSSSSLGASKGGLDMLTKVMGLELGPHNVSLDFKKIALIKFSRKIPLDDLKSCRGGASEATLTDYVDGARDISVRQAAPLG